jgi:hypothetical protein
MPISTYTHQMLDPTAAAGSVVVVGANDVVEDAALVEVMGAVAVVDVGANVEVTGAVAVVDVGANVEVTGAVVVVDICASAARAAASALARTFGSPYWCMWALPRYPRRSAAEKLGDMDPCCR